MTGRFSFKPPGHGYRRLNDYHDIINQMKQPKHKIGKVIIPGDVNVWRHEELTAKALAAAGDTVEFIRKSERENETSADLFK
jgi:hypothetical protein